ncbi:uncharacterized protein J3R85_006306 [Psidium guajava]|nr:uncharacterized protein J3R85_006306 [Psidium guajava]
MLLYFAFTSKWRMDIAKSNLVECSPCMSCRIRHGSIGIRLEHGPV